MSTEGKTHWKKHLDSRYISGEDLQTGLNGLKPEMTVILKGFDDRTTFDQKTQQDVVKTGIFMTTVEGVDIYKPAILNTTNASFLTKEFGSAYMEDWIGRTVVMYAKPDKRFGYVVRFKTFHKMVLKKDTAEFEKCKTALSNGYTMDKLKNKYDIKPDVESLLLGNNG